MATIKSYTDINQSKNLSKILPMESADMRYQVRYDSKNNLKYIPGFISTIIPLRVDIPCWSLAALLGVLRIYTTPTAFSINISVPSLTKTKDGYSITYVGDYRIMESNNNDIESPIEIVSGNPIDACVEMIIKLHEMNLL